MVISVPDPSTRLLRGEAVCDGQLVIPIGREVPLGSAALVQAAAEEGGIGNVLLVA